ncbi:MAG: ABC transporter substrate-binding protein [Clostridia bacterium]|nr:ABC transporter substrate-binding protein [Clostridia bacterium]
MKKWFALLLAVSMLFTLSAGALAEGVTLKTVSSFAGTDASADAYTEILKAFEAETGNTVVDSSSTSDEAWKASVLNDFAAGNEPDVLFFFAASADSKPILDKVVPIEEINAAYPDLNLTENAVLTEDDGKIYAIPSRPFWEGLFVNTDLFEEYGLELPTDWAKLEAAVAKFNEVGIVPIAVSLSDIPHYIAEFAIIACGTPEEHMARPKSLEEVPDSWYEGMELIAKLYEMGAFAKDVNATTEAVTSQMFKDKKAAMQIDGSWFANGIPQSSMDTTIVIPFPTYAEDADPTAFIGGVSMGFYLTRKAWDDPEKRDEAVALLAYLTNADSAAKLGGYQFSGKLLESSYEMINNAKYMLSPFQDAMSKEARETWLLGCIASVADGSMSAQECWEKVMTISPVFGD